MARNKHKIRLLVFKKLLKYFCSSPLEAQLNSRLQLDIILLPKHPEAASNNFSGKQIGLYRRTYLNDTTTCFR